MRALAFKVVADRYVGTLTYVRIYAGSLSERLVGVDPARNRRVRVGEGSSACTRTGNARRWSKQAQGTS